MGGQKKKVPDAILSTAEMTSLELKTAPGSCVLVPFLQLRIRRRQGLRPRLCPQSDLLGEISGLRSLTS